MDTTSEASGTLWSPAQLREHEYLTLATDLALLKCMQNLSKKVVTQSKSLIADLDSLDRDTVSAIVKVENCVQNLNLISTKQFTEKRVYDEESKILKEVSQTLQPAATNAVNVVPKIREGILSGLPVINSQFSVLQEGLIVSKIDQTPGGVGGYSFRPLPYILGSSEFISSKAVGVESVLIEKSLDKSEEKEDVSVKYHNANALVNLSNDLLKPQTTPSSTVSLEVSKATLKNEQAEANDFSEGLIDVRTELEARIKTSSIKNSILVSTKQIGQSSADDNLSKPRVANPEFDQQEQPFTPPALPFTPPPILKSKGLFDDSTGESDEESLFREKSKTLPSSQNSSVKSVNSSNHHSYMSEQVASLPAQSNLNLIIAPIYGVPSNTSQIPIVTTKHQSSNSAPSSRDNALRQTGNSILENKKCPDLFFSSDSEDDFFAAPEPKLQQSIEKQLETSTKSQTDYHASKKTVSNQANNQDTFDSVSSKIEDYNASNVQSISVMANQASKHTAILNKGKSLFSDSESDDDLFGFVQSKTNSKPITSLYKSELIRSSIEPNQQPTLDKRSEKLNDQNGRIGIQGNNITTRQAHPTAVKLLIPGSQRRSDIYSEDEEDLFVSVRSTNNHPSMNQLLVPNTTQNSTPQESHAVIINQPALASNVSSSKVENVPEKLSTAVHKKTTDAFFSNSPPLGTSLFYSDESDDDLFKPSKENLTGLRKNFSDVTHKVCSLQRTESPKVSPNSLEKEEITGNVSELLSSLTSNPEITTQEPPGHLNEISDGNGEIREPLLQSTSSNRKLKDICEANAPPTHLCDLSDDDLFEIRQRGKTTASLSSIEEPLSKSPLNLSSGLSTVEKNISTVLANHGSGIKPQAKSYLSNSLVYDSDGESLVSRTAKPVSFPCGSMLQKRESPALDRSSEISYTKDEAPQVSETKYSEDGVPIKARSVPNLSPWSSDEPSLLSSDHSIKPVNINPESGPYDAKMPAIADSLCDAEVTRTQKPENQPSNNSQTTNKSRFQQLEVSNRSAPVVQAKAGLYILESSDDDDLFGPRVKSITPSKPLAQERKSIPELKNNLKEAVYPDDANDVGIDVNTGNFFPEQPTFTGNRAFISDVPKKDASVEQNQTPSKRFANSPKPELPNANVARNNPSEATGPTDKLSPLPLKKLMHLQIEECDEESEDIFKGASHGLLATRKALPTVLSGSSQNSETDASVHDTKGDSPPSYSSVIRDFSSEKETSVVDDNLVAKDIEKSVKSLSESRIASLKLSLAQQSTVLRLPSPDTQPGSSSYHDGNPNNVFRKPFGAVPLFGPSIIPSAKRRSPESTESSPSSLTNVERTLLVKPLSDSVLRNAAVDILESVTVSNPDSLLCAGRTRPRLPSSRRPPTRNFRRSRILENESEDDDNVKPIANEESKMQITCGNNTMSAEKLRTSITEAPERPNVKLSVTLEGKLFDDSDSSDDELFKPASSVKKPQDILPRTNIPSEKLNQSEISEERLSSNLIKSSGGKSLPPFFLDDDSDDDLFAGPPKSHCKTTQITPSFAKNPIVTPAQDPLSRMSE